VLREGDNGKRELADGSHLSGNTIRLPIGIEDIRVFLTASKLFDIGIRLNSKVEKAGVPDGRCHR